MKVARTDAHIVSIHLPQTRMSVLLNSTRWAAPIANISRPVGAKSFMPALRSEANERKVYTPDLSSEAREVFTFDVSHLTFDVSHLTFELLTFAL